MKQIKSSENSNKKHKKQPLFIMIPLITLLLCVFALTSGKKKTQTYGVFLGINGDEISILDSYETVVIEPTEFTNEQIAQLHHRGKTVYAYLNIGSIEEYRPYYDDYKIFALDSYENWPDEQWIDVSQSDWQQFLVDELGSRYAQMGFDGLFLDNADVYYNYPMESIYEGLLTILQGLRNYPITLIINGGDTFVSRTVEEGIAGELFDGVNQETVFTSIDFENRTYSEQSAEETEYFKDYLQKVKNAGLSVYLLEYGADTTLAGKIEKYCSENHFIWYNAPNLGLTY